METKSVGKIVSEKRYDERLTLVKVSEMTGVSHPYLSQIENDHIKNVSPAILRKLSDGLKIPYHKLMVAAGYIREVS